MLSIIKKNRRGLNVLGLLLFWMMGAVSLLGYEIELGGSLFVFCFFTTLFYFPFLWLLKQVKLIELSRKWKRRETLVCSTIVSLCCLEAAIEAFPAHMHFSILYAELAVLASAFFFLNYRYKKQSNTDYIVFKKWVTPKYRNLTLVAAITMFILVLAIYEYEPLVNLLAFFYIVALFVIGVRWLVKQMKLIIDLKNEKAKTELVHLQSQVNPHFFFNVLNNLYGLVKQDSEKAQDLILKLSDMMRYSIYKGQQEKVKLEDEVAYLKNFIELHQMRYRKQIEVKFNLHIQEEGYQVMPLMFVILLENAFKHGVERLRSNAYVHIHLIAGGGDISFAIENNFDKSEAPERAGIGLQNLKRRLELVYPNEHTLSFSETDDIYKAQLTLRLL